MPSAVENYMQALNEQQAISAEAASVAGIVANAATMLPKLPNLWKFAPPYDHRETKADSTIWIDHDNQEFLDPVTWPTVDLLLDIQRRYAVACAKTGAALKALSPSELTFVQGQSGSRSRRPPK